MARAAVQLGFTDVSRYPGGIGDWFTAGYFRQTVDADGAEWLLSNLVPPPVPVDVRSAADFAVSHIPGARNEPLAGLAVDPAASLADLDPVTDSIILYDAGAPGATLIDVAIALETAGFRGVFLYFGGFADWVAAGKTVE